MKLDELSLNELQRLRMRVDKEIASRRAQVRREGIEKIKSIAKQYDLSINELKTLTGTKGSSGKRSKVAPKYADPKNPSNTWSGRGRKPKWVEAFLKSGGQLSQITV